MSGIVVAALYRFTPFADPAALRAPLARLCCAQGVKGTLLLAAEGINGTIAGTRAGIDAVLAHLRGLPGCTGLTARESCAATMPFNRMKVRLKREIVTLGQPQADPTRAVGIRVAPRDWNDLIRSNAVAVIDTRNAYEVAIGSFAGAIDPGTERFGAFPDWWQVNRARFGGRPVAMFCTGGIRCEKATSYLLSEGVKEVFHLEGGILNYLEQVPAADSLWRGECYVFDHRVSVGHGLVPGTHVLCHACGRPVAEADRDSPGFEAGVSCPACIAEYDAADRARFRERQRQIARARTTQPATG